MSANASSDLPDGTAIVAGAAGFVGSHLCDRLVADGWRVVGIDDLSTGDRSNLAALDGKANFSLVTSDICAPLPTLLARALSEAPAEGRRIYNLACPASPPDYQAQPVQTILTCTVGMNRLLDLATSHGARLLQASTSEVYGDPLVHPQPESDWGHANPIGPRSCYDEGKRCAEALCFAWYRQHLTDIRVARLFNSYGPRLRPGDGRVVSNFIVQALAGKPLTVYGDGRQTRSFCHVRDTVEGLVRLMEGEATGPVNIGNPQERTILDLAQAVLRVTGSTSALRHEPLPTDDPVRRRPDITLARTLLGWEPRIGLDDGLRDTVGYFRNRRLAAPSAQLAQA